MPHFRSSTPLQKAKKELVQSRPSGWKLDASFDETRKALGKSFCGNKQVEGEPVLAWIVGSSFDKKISNDVNTVNNSKEGLCTFIMSFVANQAIKDGALVLVKTTPEDDRLGATALLIEQQKSRGCWKKIREDINWIVLGVRLAMTEGVPDLTKEKTPEDKTMVRQIKTRGDHMMKLLNEWHSQYASGVHWYVKAVGTDPDCQGQGLGSAMMRKINELADSRERDLYLECGEEKNKNFYLKFGYEVVGEHEVTDPTGCEHPIPVYCMLRKYTRHSL